MSVTYDELTNPHLEAETPIGRAIRDAIGADEDDHRFRLEATAYIGPTTVDIVIEATGKNFTADERHAVATLCLTRRDLDIMRRILETLEEEDERADG